MYFFHLRVGRIKNERSFFLYAKRARHRLPVTITCNSQLPYKVVETKNNL